MSTTPTPDSSSEVILHRHKDGKLAIQSAPELFVCSRESIQDLIDQHNAYLSERDLARHGIILKDATIERLTSQLAAARDEAHNANLRADRAKRDSIKAEADKGRLSYAINQIGFYFAGTDHQHISAICLRILDGECLRDIRRQEALAGITTAKEASGHDADCLRLAVATAQPAAPPLHEDAPGATMATEDSTKPAPCPQCSNGRLEVFPGNSGWWIGCKPCSNRADGPRHLLAKTREEAIRKWNSAAAAPAPITDKQKDLIVKIGQENNLPPGKVDALARERFGKTPQLLTRTEATALIDELLEPRKPQDNRRREP